MCEGARRWERAPAGYTLPTASSLPSPQTKARRAHPISRRSWYCLFTSPLSPGRKCRPRACCCHTLSVRRRRAGLKGSSVEHPSRVGHCAGAAPSRAELRAARAAVCDVHVCELCAAAGQLCAAAPAAAGACRARPPALRAAVHSAAPCPPGAAGRHAGPAAPAAARGSRATCAPPLCSAERKEPMQPASCAACNSRAAGKGGPARSTRLLTAEHHTLRKALKAISCSARTNRSLQRVALSTEVNNRYSCRGLTDTRSCPSTIARAELQEKGSGFASQSTTRIDWKVDIACGVPAGGEMQAISISAPGNPTVLKIGEVPKPPLKPNELRLKCASPGWCMSFKSHAGAE